MDTVERGSTKQLAPNAVLPPDGRSIRVSSWRHGIVWAGCGWFALLDLSVAIKATEIGGASALGLASFALVSAVFSLRIPLSGLSLETDGVRSRTPFWTYRWSWRTVEMFELRGEGAMHRLRIHLQDGKVKKVYGFSGRGLKEEARAQALFKALEERLAAEQGGSKVHHRFEPDEDFGRDGGGSALPERGEVVLRAQRRRRDGLISVATLVLAAVGAIAYAQAFNDPVFGLAAIGPIAAAVITVRLILSGTFIEPDGMKLRNVWRTFRWQWKEIARFERHRVEGVAQIHIKLCNGQLHPCPGLFARSDAEEARQNTILGALETRRALGTAKLS